MCNVFDNALYPVLFVDYINDLIYPVGQTFEAADTDGNRSLSVQVRP